MTKLSGQSQHWLLWQPEVRLRQGGQLGAPLWWIAASPGPGCIIRTQPLGWIGPWPPPAACMKSRSGTPHLVYEAAPGRTCAAAQPCPAPAALQLHPVHQQRRGGLGGFAKSGADSGDGSIRTRAWGSQSPRLVHAYALVMAPSGSRGGGGVGPLRCVLQKGLGHTTYGVPNGSKKDTRGKATPRPTSAVACGAGPPARWPRGAGGQVRQSITGGLPARRIKGGWRIDRDLPGPSALHLLAKSLDLEASTQP